MKNETPLMRQYKEIKNNYPDEILFFRLGDFYEMFFEDAKIASKELDIVLTSRNKEKGVDVPLAGFPHHSAAQYIAKLIERGYSVAVCEQVEDPKTAKGIVKREVVKVITPGTVCDMNLIDSKSNNFILSIKIFDKLYIGFSYLDVTTGEFFTREEKIGKNFANFISKELSIISPSEVIIDKNSYDFLIEKIDFKKEKIEQKIKIILNKKIEPKYLEDYFNVISLESFGLKNKKYAILSAAILLDFVQELYNYSKLPINKIEYIDDKNIMQLNTTVRDTLELLPVGKKSIGTLFWAINKTKTAMGARLLKANISRPSIDIKLINKRYNDIEFFIENAILKENVTEKLKLINDIERLFSKFVLNVEIPRDITALKNSLKSSVEIAKFLNETNLFEINVEYFENILSRIDKTFNEELPTKFGDVSIIKIGFSNELDEVKNISGNAKDFLIQFEQDERKKTEIKNLKIRYNKMFGYFIEITKSNISKVPENYIKKQSMVNANRYITNEIKEYEAKILNSKNKINELEYQILKDFNEEITSEYKKFKNLANNISYVDLIISYAELAIENNYTRPEILEDNIIDIKTSRHPVVEKLIGSENFVSNDIFIDNNEKTIILTGPNMAGKSTYMKQIAIILIMSHIGSFVPATNAKIGIVDKIFTRVGANDNIMSGESTFMVEMSEVSNIINNATSKSFIILDEVGRGTSTFDGLSIARAVTEYLTTEISAKLIFATHYHELTELEKEYKQIVNFRFEVLEEKKEILFLRKIVRGGADKSYGIEVAKLAGLPPQILNRSYKILKELERNKRMLEKQIDIKQLSLFDLTFNENLKEKEDEEESSVSTFSEIDTKIIDLNINETTPLKALNFLSELKNYYKTDE